MIVHLAGSLRDPETDLVYLQQIVQAIHDRGSVLAHNWIEHDLLRHEKAISIDDWTPYVRENLKAVKQADIVIIETTHRAFSQGFLLAAAMEHKKPTLIVSQEAFSDKYISGLTSSLLTLQTYTTKDELRSFVDAFIVKNTVHTKDLRFNMFLTREIVKFLEEKSHETGYSQSEIIRDLVKREAQK